MKIIAIANRGSRKDFIDLFFLMKKEVSPKELFKLPINPIVGMWQS